MQARNYVLVFRPLATSRKGAEQGKDMLRSRLAA